MLAEKKKK